MSACDVAAGSSGMSSAADESLLCPHMMQRTASPSFFEPGIFMEVWQIPLFVCHCCDASVCFGRFSVHSETLAIAIVSSDINLLHFLHQYKITSPHFPFFILEMRTGVKRVSFYHV